MQNTSTPVTGGVRKSGFRRDIQGLRAVAVLAVIVNHAVGALTGGFLGVDVFFVISGFIITALLLREVERTGRISFLGFYKRRVKRILPAATLVLVVTVAASYILIGGERARQIAGDALAATFFVSNWRFAAAGTDYWADDGTTSPLQHYWSLGVEEQFYIVWPLLIALVALILHRRRALKPVLAVVLLVIAGASVMWAAHETDAAPMWAYFSTLTRAWELAVGALVAVGASQLGRVPQGLRPYLAWAGIAALGYAFFTVGEGEGMPVPGAFVAVLATALIIAAGTGSKDESTVWPLSNRVSSYIGDISYSLYLWHLPVIVFLGAYFAHHERRFLLSVLAITALLSVASYHFVENPIRRSTWMEQGAGRTSHLFTLAASVVVVGLIAATSVVTFIRPAEASASAAPAMSATPDTQAELTEYLADAGEADDWPALNPSPGDLSEHARVDEKAGCSPADVRDPESCWFPSDGAERTAFVMGDSTAITLISTVRHALGEDWNVRGTTKPACPQVEFDMWFPTDEEGASCAAHQDAALQLVAAERPDVVFVQDVYRHVTRANSEADPAEGAAVEWALATSDLLAELRKYAGTVILVQSPPKGAVLAECAVPGKSPEACEMAPDEIYDAVHEAERAAAQTVGVPYVETEKWYCAENGCPAFVGSVALKHDDVHTSKLYAEMLGPVLREAVAGIVPLE